ncbi:MAG: hypothetical protein RJA44_248 [Pseudomonadota bacterium]|jgi:hypothetical protein
MNIHELTQKIIDTIPAEQRFSADDAALVAQHKDYLLGLENELVQGFYDAIERSPQMAALISHGSRSEREMVLRRWWQRTLQGPFDGQYWAWQTLVGVVHIKAGVENPMMMGMWQWIMTWLRSRIGSEAPGGAATAAQLMASLERLALMTQTITAESYLRNYLETVVRLTGFKPALLDRMFKAEIDTVLREARQQLGSV